MQKLNKKKKPEQTKFLYKKQTFFSKILNFFSRLFSAYLFRAVLILAIIFFILIFLIYISEEKSNSRINTLFDAFWFSLVTITTVGYGDITPATFFGRFAGIVLLLFGVVTFAGISGKVASVLFDMQMKKDRGFIRLKKIKHHFLICGWKPNFDKILSGILQTNPDIPLDHIVLINTADPQNMEVIKTDKRFKGITYIFGDHTDEETLKRAKIEQAERVLILADYSQNFSDMEIDSRTVLAVLTIGNLNPNIYTAAEIIDTKFERHLSVAHCDEVILTTDYERSFIVSASSGTGLSHVLYELINESSDDGLVISDINKSFIGKTYREYRRSLTGGKVLIGLLENTGNFYNRRREALSEAQKTTNIQEIVSNLKRLKKLKSNLPVLTPPDEYIIKPNSRGIFVVGRKRTEFTSDGSDLDQTVEDEEDAS